MIFVLSDQNTLANQFLVELRDKNVQLDRPRFRRNLERLGEIMAYEISKKLEYKMTAIETPLGQARIQVLRREPVLVTILRAGLPFYQGFQNFFDRSEVGFIGAYRKEGTHITVQLDYVAAPGLSGKEVILIDPMLATGKSVTDAVNAILKNGRPDHIHVAALVAAPEGVAYLEENLSTAHTLWTFAVDEKLSPQSYIVPGLGDAGDLSYGPKL